MLLAALLLAPMALVPAALAQGAPQPRPGGGWRVPFAPGAEALAGEARAALAGIGRQLATQPGGRITVEAQASGPAEDASIARRIALARARAVREALTQGGLAETRVDIRALGRTEAALDAADILPPGHPRTATR